MCVHLWVVMWGIVWGQDMSDESGGFWGKRSVYMLG